jgi:hypothetical protein
MVYSTADKNITLIRDEPKFFEGSKVRRSRMSITYSRFFMVTLLSVILVSLLGLAACRTARMACPPELSASAIEMPVTGRQGFGLSKSFRFGPYDVSDVHRGWRVTTTWSIFGYGSSKSEQPFEFKLRTHDNVDWQAHCATGVRWKEMELNNFMDTGGVLEWGLSSHALFTCEFSPPEKKRPWKMVMKQETQNLVLDGLLSDGATRISIKGTRELEGGAWPLTEATGYLFYSNQDLVGAVDVVNQGAVWIEKELSDNTRRAAAAAASALLLHKDLKD